MLWEKNRIVFVALAALVAVGVGPPVAAGSEESWEGGETTAPPSESATARVLGALEEPSLRELAEEVLSRNPGLAAAAARVRAAAARAPQARALPDPVAGLTAFLATPETRTGPQRISLALSQGLPWFGKLALREKAELWTAAALEAELEAERLRRLTETRRLYYEIAFLDRFRQITEGFRGHLEQHEEISRARYSTGVGLGQAVVKLQAEITRVEKELLGIGIRRAVLVSQLNGARDQPAVSPLPVIRPEALLGVSEVALDRETLVGAALETRPELRAADARTERAATLVKLAEKGYRPDFKIGLTYTVVDSRDDMAGRLQPPEGNGDDIIGIHGGITLPIRRGKLAAAVDGRNNQLLAEREVKREVAARIAASIGALTQRVDLAWRQLRLVEDLLIVQAEESLESAQAGYVAGKLDALDLLDAEHVLFEARTAVARASADYLIGLADLEGEVGRPLADMTKTEQNDE